jgi:hypothetical protein
MLKKSAFIWYLSALYFFRAALFEDPSMPGDI